ncbi:MAG: hypothetical protein ACOY3D_04795 [Candidatus Omnitrophota bacterium]
MLSAIREIGKWERKKSNRDVVSLPIKNAKIIFIKINTDEIKFDDVELEDGIC